MANKPKNTGDMPADEFRKYGYEVVDWIANYFERIEEFRRWLRAVRGVTLLCNSAELVEWNLDKHFLADLHAGGIPVVETRFVERGSGERLTELLSAAGWERAVLKPCVSGAARHTYLWTLAESGVLEPIARDLLKTESLSATDRKELRKLLDRAKQGRG